MSLCVPPRGLSVHEVILERMTIASETPTRSRFHRIRDSFFGAPFAVTQLPALSGLRIDPEKLKEAAHVKQLSDLTVRAVRQVCLSVLDRTEMLRELRTSLEDRCIVWVIECPTAEQSDALTSAFPNLCVLLGQSHTGTQVFGIHTASLMRQIIRNTPEDLHYFSEIDTAYLPHDIERSLKKHRIALYHTSWLVQRFREPRTWVYITIFLYSALRALPAMWVPQFHGSVFWLWTIDILTAIPYTWGLLAMFTASKFWLRLAGFITTVVTFVAPYVYFWMHGDNYPKTVVIFIVVMIALSVASEVWRYITEKRLANAYLAR